MNTAGQIVVSDAEEALKEEIEKLRAVLAGLTSERDDLLYHICPELEARYAREIGDRFNRINYQRITILELKRRIEIARAALNHEKTVSQQDVDDQIHKEYGKFHDQVNEEFKKAEQAKKEQREKEERQKQYEKEWQKRYGSGTGGSGNADSGNGNSGGDRSGTNGTSDNGNEGSGQNGSGHESSGNGGEHGGAAQGNSESGGGQTKVPDIKALYRKIIKKLHPDVNPDATAREKELLLKAVKAYEDGDIVTMQEIYDEVFGDGTAEETKKELSCEELLELKEKLTERIEKLRAEIENIKKNFPYRVKEFLDNPDAVKARRDALDEEIHRNEETIIRLTQLLEEISQEMEELRKKQK